MSLVARNAPCPCGSGQKYKKCCLRRDEERRLAQRERIVDGPERRFATNLNAGMERHADAHTWPIERVYVPVADVWRATGMGSAAVVRRRPDGRIAHSAFLLKL